MNSYKLLALIFFICAISGVTSCKKKSNSSSPGKLRLALIDVSHQGAIEHYRIVYDVYNNVDSMVIVGGGTDTGSNGYMVFNYFGSSYSITDQNNNSFTVAANTNGVILEVLTTDTLTMAYSGTELTGLTTTIASAVYPFYTRVAATYLWSNGDIVFSSSPTAVDSFDYNTSKSGQIGDAFRIDEFLAYGRPYIETNHLPVDFTSSGTWVEHFFYQFDGQGRITQFLKVENNNGINPDDSTFYNYQYYAD